MYCVVVLGAAIEMFPAVPTEPCPLMLPEVALVEVKARVTPVLEPAVMLEGVAVNVAVGGGPPLLEEEPPQDARKIVWTNRTARDQPVWRSNSKKRLIRFAALTPA
jgi:hypothetical protein